MLKDNRSSGTTRRSKPGVGSVTINRPRLSTARNASSVSALWAVAPARLAAVSSAWPRTMLLRAPSRSQ